MAATQLATTTRSPARAQAGLPPSTLAYGAANHQSWLLRSATAASAALLLAGAGAALIGRARRARAARRGEVVPSTRTPASHAARRMNQGAAVLAFSVLADSALEHYTAHFRRPAMYAAPAVAFATLTASLRATARGSVRRLDDAVFLTALLAGLLGTGFHLANLTRQPGGVRTADGRIAWTTLLYGAPAGAPLALSLSGALSLAAGRLRARERRALPREVGARSRPATGALVALASAGLLGTSMEVWLLHFRGAFQNPFMYVPVVVPPVAATALATTALVPSARMQRATRALLAATALTGIAGVGFHAYGVQRNMGGFSNWSQMLLQGPPLPAPPAFTGLAVAALGVLGLLGDDA